MTLLDLATVLIVVVYVALGWFTGTVRRVLGLIIVVLALWVATNMGQQGASMVDQFSPGVSVPDARAISWVFFFLLLVLVLELAATALHTQLQLAVVALNRAVGVLVGLATAAVVITGLVYMAAGFAQPTARQPDQLQIKTRDAVVGSSLGYPLAKSLSGVILPLINVTLPRDPKGYFFLEGTGS